jgi:hypothetical protein
MKILFVVALILISQVIAGLTKDTLQYIPQYTPRLTQATDLGENSRTFREAPKTDINNLHLLTRMERTLSLSGGLRGLESDFIEASRVYRLNLYLMPAIAILESANGTSKIAVDKNNLFGFGAYDKSPYESAFTYETKRECIMKVAKFIREEYLTEGGRYFNGYYLEDMNVCYCTDSAWAGKVKKIMEVLYESSNLLVYSDSGRATDNSSRSVAEIH